MFNMVDKMKSPCKKKLIQSHTAKIIMLLMVMLLGISMISALDFKIDNVGWYSENDMKIEIRNWFGLTRIGDATLTSHSHVDEIKSVIAGEDRLVMQYDINFDAEYKDGIGDIKFIDEKTGKEVSRPYYFAKAIYGDAKVNDFDTKCSLNKNMTEVCVRYISGSHIEKKVVDWERLDNRDIKAGNYTVGLFVDVYRGDHIDGIWTLAGQPITKHASWSDTLSVGLWAYWNFNSDTTNASNVRDMLNSTQNGTSTNLTTAFTSITGILGEAIDLNGTTGINFGNQDTVFGNGAGNNYTLSIWIRGGKSVSGTSTFWANVNSDSLGTDDVYSYLTSDTNMVFATEDGDERNVNANNTLQETWQHFVFWKNATTLRAWQNGTLNIEVIGDVFEDKTDASNKFVIGDNLNVVMLNASIDETGIWARALTDSEVSDLWNNGAGITYNQNPYVSLNSTPADTEVIYSATVTLGANATDDIGLLNTSLYIDGALNSTDYNTTSGQTSLNISRQLTFDYGTYNWSAFACDESNACVMTANKTFTSSIWKQNASSDTTSVGSTVVFNLTLNQTAIPTTKAWLNYNNTFYDPDFTTAGGNHYYFERSITIPNGTGSITGNSINWSWVYNISGFGNRTTDNATQLVYSIAIDDCSTYTKTLLNFSYYDEELNSLLNITSRESAEIEVDVTMTSRSDSSISATYQYNSPTNTTNITICIPNLVLNTSSEDYETDVLAHFLADDYVEEYYWLDNWSATNSTIPKEIILRGTRLSDSTSFIASYEDEDNQLVTGAIISVLKKYVGENIFREAENGRTNDDGETILHLVEEDVIYRFNVSIEDRQVYLSDEFRVYCATTTDACTISLDVLTGVTDMTEDFDNLPEGSCSIDWDKSTRIVELVCSLNATHTMNLTLYKYSNNQTADNIPIGSNSSDGLNPTVSLTVDWTYDNSTYFAEVYKDNSWIASRYVDLKEEGRDYFGDSIGVFFTGLIVLALGLMAVSRGIGVLVFSVIGLLFASLSYIFDVGYATIIFIICAVGIIIYKARKN